MCRWLEVSPSGYYAWKKRQISQRHLDDQKLLELITKIYWQSQGIYGSPRVFKSLKSKGMRVGRKRVERLMKEAGLRGRQVRVTRRMPGFKRFKAAGNNLLLKLAAPTAIDKVWVADVTYLKVNGKWNYLATVMDQYSRRILGWSLSRSRNTELTSNALNYALKKRKYPKGLIFHTDRGIEYTGLDFQAMLNKYTIKHSVNRPGYCTDNAFMESFFHSLKVELIRGNVFKCANKIRQALSDYINNFYNSVRLHSGLDYKSPIEYERCLT